MNAQPRKHNWTKPVHIVEHKRRSEGESLARPDRVEAQRRTHIPVTLVTLALPSVADCDEEDFRYGAWLHHEIAAREEAGTIERVREMAE